MVISGIFIESTSGQAHSVAEELNKMTGVEVHHIEDDKIVLTIEATTVDESYRTAELFKDIKGVLTTCLAYSNFEDDPFYQQAADLV